LWDQDLLSPIIENIFNTKWQVYATSLRTDSIINSCVKANGIFYLICAILSLTLTKTSSKLHKGILYTGGVFLVLLSLLITKSKFYHIVMFFEHSIQFATPFAMLYFLKTNDLKKLLLILKILIALTFVSHGMYAVGIFYPLPGNFVSMTLNILPVTEDIAKQFLFAAGILDFLVALLIFIPKTVRPALIYAAIWGFLTAFARIISGLKYGVNLDIIMQYLHTTIYRMPHGLIPLIAYIILKQCTNSKKTT
tara:strand:- start:11735 stop:12487 length:753 start_codon:yes stop_codon:yes gene_type:complete